MAYGEKYSRAKVMNASEVYQRVVESRKREKSHERRERRVAPPRAGARHGRAWTIKPPFRPTTAPLPHPDKACPCCSCACAASANGVGGVCVHAFLMCSAQAQRISMPRSRGSPLLLLRKAGSAVSARRRACPLTAHPDRSARHRYFHRSCGDVDGCSGSAGTSSRSASVAGRYAGARGPCCSRLS